MGALGRSLAALPLVSSIACGTLLSVSDDPAPPDLRDGGGGAAEGGSETGSPQADADADAGAEVSVPPQNQLFVTSFDPPNDHEPWGWDRHVEQGGMSNVGPLVNAPSAPNGIAIQATGGTFLQRMLDVRAKHIIVTLRIRVNQFPQATMSNVTLMDIACGTLPPLGEVELRWNGTAVLEQSGAFTSEKMLPLADWRKLAFDAVVNGSGVTMKLEVDDVANAELVSAPPCQMGSYTLRVGALFNAGQSPGGTPQALYVYDLDDIKVDVRF